MMQDIRRQAERFGVEFRMGSIIEVDTTSRPFRVKSDMGDELLADTIVVATGASARWLGVKGEDQFKGGGVSACATCDGFFFKGRDVAVVGGGDTACEDALYLSNLCKKVYLVVRKNYLRASEIMQQRVKDAENIEILFEHNATGLYGENGVEGMHLVYRKGEADEKKYDVAIDGFFLAIGHKPNTDIFKGQIDLDEMGYIKNIAGTPRTNVEGVFAAGDVCDPTYRQAIVAAGSGCMAALEAQHYLQNNV
jgi:thioredoxin reductase (NADPH)